MNPAVIFIFTKIASVETFATLILGVSIWLFLRSRRKEALLILLAGAATMLSVWGLKTWLAIPRPPHQVVEVSRSGFPSGHATGVMFLALIGYFLFVRSRIRTRKLIIAFGLAIIVLAVGLSRIYFNVHTPIQVFGGYVLGAFWALAVYVIQRYFK